MSDQAAPAPPDVPDHEIITLPAAGHRNYQPLLDQCLNVRVEVFVHEQGFSLDDEFDKHDPTATHFLLRLLPSKLAIGTIRGTKMVDSNGDAYYKLSRLAVLKPYRRYRFGRDLVLALHGWVKEDAKRSSDVDMAKVVAHSQISVKQFYSKYGYLQEGEEFDEEGAPHQKMVAYLSLQQD
ncbi:acyl-CoA N-acyltransferase [Pisolithus sp. B1]|nr:acyl-CoA N-acyltransferase [Pisolithus sp. B1]